MSNSSGLGPSIHQSQPFSTLAKTSTSPRLRVLFPFPPQSHKVESRNPPDHAPRVSGTAHFTVHSLVSLGPQKGPVNVCWTHLPAGETDRERRTGGLEKSSSKGLLWREAQVAQPAARGDAGLLDKGSSFSRTKWLSLGHLGVWCKAHTHREWAPKWEFHFTRKTRTP